MHMHIHPYYPFEGTSGTPALRKPLCHLLLMIPKCRPEAQRGGLFARLAKGMPGYRRGALGLGEAWGSR